MLNCKSHIINSYIMCVVYSFMVKFMRFSAIVIIMVIVTIAEVNKTHKFYLISSRVCKGEKKIRNNVAAI